MKKLYWDKCSDVVSDCASRVYDARRPKILLWFLSKISTDECDLMETDRADVMRLISFANLNRFCDVAVDFWALADTGSYLV